MRQGVLFLIVLYVFMHAFLAKAFEGRFMPIDMENKYSEAFEKAYEYGLDDDPKRALGRFYLPLGILALDMDRYASVGKTLDYIIENDTRNQLFKLEALLRIYKKDKENGDLFEELLIQVKALEDAMGKYAEKLEYLEFAQKIEADQAVIDWISGEAKEFRSLLFTELEDNWKSEGENLSFGIFSLAETLDSIDFKGYKKDKKFVLKRIRKKLAKVGGTDYDMSLLQEGVHEFRRQMRWFPLYFQSLQGLINFSEGTGYSYVDELNELMNDPQVSTNKYVLFDVSLKEKDPQIVSYPYYLKMSQVVGSLGRLKSVGENFHYVEEAYVQAGVLDNLADAHEVVSGLAAEKGIKKGNVSALAGEIYESIQNADLFNLVIEDLELE